MLAGMRYDGTNNYLRDSNNSYWWSHSPGGFSNGNANVWDAISAGGIDLNYVGYSVSGARPAISLKPGQNFEYGNGTTSNPYRFVETIPSS